MEHVACCQLRSLMSLMYNLVSYDKIISNIQTKDTFEMKLKWSNNYTIKQYLPIIKAPSSTVIYWSNRLGLCKRMDIKMFDNFGYTSVLELVGELAGFYKFYEKSRYIL